MPHEYCMYMGVIFLLDETPMSMENLLQRINPMILF